MVGTEVPSLESKVMEYWLMVHFAKRVISSAGISLGNVYEEVNASSVNQPAKVYPVRVGLAGT